jgi:hypothetical protein
MNGNTGTISTNVTQIESTVANKAKAAADAAAAVEKQRQAQAASQEKAGAQPSNDWKNQAYSSLVNHATKYAHKASKQEAAAAKAESAGSLQRNLYMKTGMVLSAQGAKDERNALAGYGLSEGEYSSFLINALSGVSWGKSAGKYNGYKFASGGLNTQTGPAWLDGTYAKPELVLNAQDTANFLELKNILRDSNLRTVASNVQNGSNLYYKIDINVDKIADNYDVDKIAKRVEQKISQASGYRNINAIKKMR